MGSSSASIEPNRGVQQYRLEATCAIRRTAETAQECEMSKLTQLFAAFSLTWLVTTQMPLLPWLIHPSPCPYYSDVPLLPKLDDKRVASAHRAT